MSDQKKYLQITSKELNKTLEEIIELAKKEEADKLHPGYYGIKFFEQYAGYYKPEEITKMLKRLRKIGDSAQTIKSVIEKSPDDLSEKATECLFRLLEELKMGAILE